MTEDLIIPVPSDRDRVAAQIRRTVRIDLDPAIAKAAAHGMSVELTETQSLAVADAALQALVLAHPIAGRDWLVKANQDWQWMAEGTESRRRVGTALARRQVDRWRAAALGAYVWLFAACCVWQWHWPRWSYVPIVIAATGAQMGLGQWLGRRSGRGDSDV
jgi:hypothetical protein